MIEAPLQGANPNDPDFASEVPFAFRTVMPGKYFIKAVWDKRAPFTDFEKPGAGDYESALTGPVELKAGMELMSIVLACTNRGPEGLEYYKADEQAARLWKAGELSPANIAPNGAVQLSRPIEHWIIKTNRAMPKQLGRLTRVAVEQRVGRDRPELTLYWIKQKDAQSLSEIDLLDSRGKALSRGDLSYRSECSFREIPTNGIFRVIGKLRDKNERLSIAFDYTLTNLARGFRSKN